MTQIKQQNKNQQGMEKYFFRASAAGLQKNPRKPDCVLDT